MSASSAPPSGAAAVPRPRPLLLRLLAMGLRAQWIVGGTCACVAIAYPQTEVYGCIAGAFANAFLGKLLKRAIAQDRPVFAAQKKQAAEKAAAAAAAAAKLKSSGVVVPGSVATSSSMSEVASAAMAEAASEVAAAAVDAAVFAADVVGLEHPEPESILAALPHPMPNEKELGHGMPSSHATSLFYFATYLTLAAYQYGYDSPSSATALSSTTPHPFIVLLRTYVPAWLQLSWQYGLARPLAVGVLYGAVSLECRSRVTRHLHSWAQIGAGAALGSSVALLHTCVVMPWVREQCKDVPPLSDRSPQFQIGVVAAFAALGLLTLERKTQRIAKGAIKAVARKITRNNSNSKPE